MMDERWAKALRAKGIAVDSGAGHSGGNASAASSAGRTGQVGVGGGVPRGAKTTRPFKSTGRKGGISRQSG
ncbi:hypothetical protein [Bifidobacterium samirii]|uniref:Uncharacterized protein n=1 Tax=Bifidobacterium samirii TaxID=2306974 RepID=A0A430FNV5_9BIFI|nr:hypothetical protein [Bifidobacterium samirii]RSX54484.1 hypothetical protein D2E24_1605 [Bifidobacterium samirii]